MSLTIQSDYKKYIQNADQILTEMDQHFEFVLGDSNFLTQYANSTKKLFLILNSSTVSVETLNILKPVHVFKLSDVQRSSHEIIDVLNSEITKIQKQQRIQSIKMSAEQKRTELEQLNHFLQDQSDEKKVSLGHFHSEELLRKNKEKKLISFLDYLNSEYEKSDFILELLKTIWSDLRKIGNFYRLGFVIQNQSHKSFIIDFDGKIDRTKSVQCEKALDISHLNQFLANIFKRPVGKLVTFLSQKSENQFIFFFEAPGTDYSEQELDSYMSDRVSLLSIVIQRWYSESSEIQILRQWQQLFKSYQNPVHVVDSEYNLVQSNYFHDVSADQKKCYQVLAGQDHPCRHCPLIPTSLTDSSKKNRYVQIKKIDYDLVSSDFMINGKKYFFIIYENVNDVGILKSNLIQAEKLATIGQLSNHLAHELNNPLTGLKLYAEMLLGSDRLINPIYENDMREVLKAVTRSQTILHDLNQFADEKQTELINLDFLETVKKTMTLLKSILRSHRIFIDLKPIQIFAQPTYLQQVLFNLIKNACQAMPNKGTLKIFQSDNENYLDFIVEDDGPGLPTEISDQIFKPFFTTKKEGQGTGLGLFISYKLMNRMNAELIYNEKFIKGTQFILRFKK